MSEQSALLAAVLADPSDDAPRLIYADWLDEQGESDRAEFIRVQVALARLVFDKPTSGMSTGMTNQLQEWREHFNSIRRREQNMLFRNMLNWHDLPIGSVSPDHWRRGFISHVKCTAADCLAHLDTIIKQHPIESVELTTWPDYFYANWDDNQAEWIDTDEEWPGRDFSEREAVFATKAAYRWPGIKFTLPQPSYNYSSNRVALDQFVSGLRMPSGVR